MTASKTADRTRSYAFTLVLSGTAEDLPQLTSALKKARIRNAQPNHRSGVLYVDLSRRGENLQDAILQAIAELEGMGMDWKVIRVEPDDLVTTSEIARRINRSRESIRLYALGERGPGGFPPPISSIKSRSPLYRWSDVADWFTTNQIEISSDKANDLDPILLEAGSIGTINAILMLRRLETSKNETMRLWRWLDAPPLPPADPEKLAKAAKAKTKTTKTKASPRSSRSRNGS